MTPVAACERVERACAASPSSPDSSVRASPCSCWWVFGSKVDAAFDSWIWPLLGLIFLPWTTLAYVLAWGPVNAVSGAGWLVVALGVAADIATYSARAAKSKYQTAY